ncbi:hypothetical protein AwMethylo_32310 [Methylobacterium sp.]|nr:hypothetical protein AwMethylo_32310 [Methylobacterium sp.]
MKRDIATLRFNFEVGGADKPIKSARDVARALDSVAAAAARNARAGLDAAAAGDRAAAAAAAQASAMSAAARAGAAAQAAAAAAAAESQARVERANEAAVRGALARYEALRKGAADAVRKAQHSADDASFTRRFELQDEKASIDAGIAARKRAREAMAARLDAMPKPRPGATDVTEADLDRRDLEMRLSDQAKLDRRSDRIAAAEKRGIDLDLKNLAREAAERVRLVREAEDARTAAAKRELDTVRASTAAETAAVKEALAEQLRAIRAAAAEREALDGAARNRVRRLAADAIARRDASATRQAFDADVAGGVRDPEALRRRMEAAQARAARARSQYESRAEAAAASLSRDPAGAQARAGELDAASGALARAEASARRLAAAYAEVQTRARAAGAAAADAARGFDRSAGAAEQRLAALKAERQYERDLNRGLRDPAGAGSRAAAFAAAYEAAAGRVVVAAAAAKAAIEAAARAGATPADLARVQASEGAKVSAAERRAARLDALARRSASVADEVARRQQRAANDAARAQEAAARRAAQAWDRVVSRSNAVRRSLPRLGLLPGNLFGRLATQGTLPVVGGLLRSVTGVASGVAGGLFGAAGALGRGVGGIFGAAGSIGRGALSLLGTAGGFFRSVVTGAFQAATAVGRIGLSAVEATARLGYGFGRGVVSTLKAVGDGAFEAAERVFRLGRRLALLGTGAAIAGVGLVKKAVSDAGEATYDLRERSMKLGMGTVSTQKFAAGTGAAGVRAADADAAFANAKEKIRDIAQDPALLATFQKLNVWTRDSYGRALDTASVIQTIMQRVASGQLNGAEEYDLLTRLFGSPEAVERILPLLQKMRQDTDYLSKAFARKRELGAVIGRADLNLMHAFNAALDDSKSALLGLKLAVSRAAGPALIESFYGLSNLIARNRYLIAGLALAGVQTLRGMGATVADGQRRLTDFSGTVGVVTQGLLDAAYYGRRFAGFLWDAGKGAFALARTLGGELHAAIRGVWAAQGDPSKAYIAARPAVIQLAEGLWYAAKGAAFLGRLVGETVLAFHGLDSRVVEFPWLLTLREGLYGVGRLARETWLTVTGRGEQVVEFPWLLTIRDKLQEAGRFAQAAWSAIRGGSEGISEFPAVFRVRDAVVNAFTMAKAFAMEAWGAIRGDNATYPQFPWLYDLADRVRAFVADVKATWADLQGVWAGGDAETTVGGWAQAALGWLAQARQGIGEFVGYARDTWAAFKEGWSADENAPIVGWAMAAGQKLRVFTDSAKTAFGILHGAFKAFDVLVRGFTWGQLDGQTVLVTAALLSMFGATRAVVGIFTAGAWAAKGLRTMLVGLAAAEAAGAATAALGGAGAAAGAAGAAAAASAGLWGGLLAKMRNVATFVKGSSILLALLGLSGKFAADSADGEDKGLGHNMWNWAKDTIGRGLEYGAMGAGVGGIAGAFAGGVGALPGAAIGGASGFLYGMLSGDGEYRELRQQAERKRAAELLQAQGKPAEAAAVLKGDKPSYEPWPKSIDGGAAEDALAQASREADAATQGLTQQLQGLTEQMSQLKAAGPGGRPAWQDGYAAAFNGASDPMAAVRAMQADAAARLGAAGDQGEAGGYQPPPRPDGQPWGVAAVPPWMRVRQEMAEASARAASAAVARAEAHAAADPMRSLMRDIDPMRSLYTAPAPAPAPVPAPAAAAPGQQSSLGGEQSVFTVRMANGREGRFAGLREDVSALRDELARSVSGPSWSVA